LEEIDGYRYNKFFNIPLQCTILGCSSADDLTQPVRPTLQDANRYFYGVELLLEITNDPDSARLSLQPNPWITINAIEGVFTAITARSLHLELEKGGRLKEEMGRQRAFLSRQSTTVPLVILLECGLFVPQLLKIVGDAMEAAYSKVLKAKTVVDREDSIDLSLSGGAISTRFSDSPFGTAFD
jgi:hypothetical protein